MRMVSDPVATQYFLDHHPDAKSIFDNALFLFSKEGRIIAESPTVAETELLISTIQKRFG